MELHCCIRFGDLTDAHSACNQISEYNINCTKVFMANPAFNLTHAENDWVITAVNCEFYSWNGKKISTAIVCL